MTLFADRSCASCASAPTCSRYPRPLCINFYMIYTLSTYAGVRTDVRLAYCTTNIRVHRSSSISLSILQVPSTHRRRPKTVLCSPKHSPLPAPSHSLRLSLLYSCCASHGRTVDANEQSTSHPTHGKTGPALPSSSREGIIQHLHASRGFVKRS
jgi:hypothetical protein